MQLKTASRHVKARTLQNRSLRFNRNLKKKIFFISTRQVMFQTTSLALTTPKINKWEGFHFHWNISFFQLNLRFLIPMWPWNFLTTGSHQGHRLSDPYEVKHHIRNIHILSARARVPLEKLPVPQLVKISPLFYGTQIHYSVNNSTPSVPILSQINPVKPFWPISLRSILNYPPTYA
jgi:hypothetical protein